MLDVRRLRVLRELAARGTIAATADALGYTPPAVSQQIAALEREAGVALLERNGRRRRLTPAGEELVSRTEAVLNALEAAEAAVERVTTKVAGTVRLAAINSIHNRLLPTALGELAQRHPDLRLSTRELEPSESLPALKLGELDLALAAEYDFAPIESDPGLERHVLADDPNRLAVPAGHPAAGAPPGSVPIEEIAGERWIAGREATFCHATVVHTCRRVGVEPLIAHRTNDFDVSYALVAAGAGVAIVPALAGPPPPGVALVEPVGGLPRRRLFAAVRTGAADRPAVAAVLSALGAGAGG
ncbi:MAG TPA: LysR family transcriptional regulator [Thermoleophilaceae bacterium]